MQGMNPCGGRPARRYPSESMPGLVRKLEKHQVMKERKFDAHVEQCSDCQCLKAYSANYKHHHVKWYCDSAIRISDSAHRAGKLSESLQERVDEMQRSQERTQEIGTGRFSSVDVRQYPFRW